MKDRQSKKTNRSQPDPALVARARAAYQRATSEPNNESPDPETLARLQRGFEGLPKLTRQIFLAHRVDGLGYPEIARITGLSEADVQKRVAIAICRLTRFAAGEERPRWRRQLALLTRWIR